MSERPPIEILAELFGTEDAKTMAQKVAHLPDGPARLQRAAEEAQWWGDPARADEFLERYEAVIASVASTRARGDATAQAEIRQKARVDLHAAWIKVGKGEKARPYPQPEVDAAPYRGLVAKYTQTAAKNHHAAQAGAIGHVPIASDDEDDVGARPESTVRSGGDEVEARESASRLALILGAFIATLPFEQRKVVMLRWAAMSDAGSKAESADLASALGKTKATPANAANAVDNLYGRARKTLRDRFHVCLFCAELEFRSRRSGQASTRDALVCDECKKDKIQEEM